MFISDIENGRLFVSTVSCSIRRVLF